MAEVLTIPEGEALSKHKIVGNLHAFADGKFVHSREGLSEFVKSHNLFRNLKAAIEMFGTKEAWVGHLERGTHSLQGYYFSASLSQPPKLEGGSYFHAFSNDGGVASYGILLPFKPDSSLDPGRVASAKWLTDENPYSFKPYHHLPLTDEINTSARIGWVAQVVAADVATFIEREWPLTLEETLA